MSLPANRPAALDFQQVLSLSLALLVKNAVPIAILAGLIVGLPSLLLRATAIDPEVAKPGIWEGLSLTGIILMVCQAMLHAAIAVGLLRQLSGQPDQKLGDLLATAWSAVVAVIGVSLVKGVVLGIFFSIGSYWWLVLPALFLLIGLWLAARWLVAVPAAVDEKHDIADALGRSRDMTADHRWTLVAWLAVLWIITWLLAKIVGGVFGVLGLGGLAHAAVMILTSALEATVAVVVYWRLKNAPERATHAA
jgi:hypothetical protein